MRKKSPEAVKLGRKGGKARWASMSPEARSQAMRAVRRATKRTP